MILDRVVLLAGYTPRSQAYVQAMRNASIAPGHTILFGSEKPVLPGQVHKCQASSSVPGLFLPDLSTPLKTFMQNEKWFWSQLRCDNINDLKIRSAIKESSPDMVIYSGYGSQLVKPALLNLNIPFLHMHSGWLPAYKGSTTIYYSWLQEQNCSVSAIYLQPGIDEGPIVLRKKYPLPPSDIDPDYVYDCAMRADLLVRVLGKLGDGKTVPDSVPQAEKGKTYYVIHPVLKHLARLSIFPSDFCKQNRDF